MSGTGGPSAAVDVDQAAEQAPSFEEASAAREGYSLLKSRRGALSLGEGGNAFYVESMYAGEGPRRTAEVRTVPFADSLVTAVHVPDPRQDEMARSLLRHHVVALSGDRGTGRRSTATALLTGCSRPRYAVSALYREDADLMQGVCDQADRILEAGRGYLIDAGSRPVTPQTLERLAQSAVRNDAYLVITGLPHCFGSSAHHDYVLEHRGAEAHEVLEAHLESLVTSHRHECRRDAERGRCDERSARAFVELLMGRAELMQTLSLARSMSGVVQLAGVLAEHIHADEAALGRIIGQWRDRLRLLAQEMLGLDTGQADDRRPGPYHQAFRLAYAMFNGYPLSDVVEAGDVLSGIVLPYHGIAEADLGRHMAEQDLSRLVPQEMRAPDTQAAGPRRARLVHEELLPAMLRSAWNGYSRLRGPYLTWLDTLVDRRGPGRERVRVRSAQIVGLLMGHDFDFVYRERVAVWAKSESGFRRQCAALALEAAAVECGEADRVASRLQSWAGSPGRPLNDSAARAYGTAIGLRDVSATFTELGRLGRKPQLMNASSISHSTAWLFLEGCVDEVLVELNGWATSRNDHLPRHAVRTMLALGRYTTSPDRQGRPALAELALGNDKNAELLVMLWSRALISRETAARAWGVLGRWLPDADRAGNEDLAELYESLAPRIFTGPLRERARFHLDRVWRPRHPGSTTLRRVLGALGPGTAGRQEGIRR
ncbi:hypothetical protein ACFRH6_01590 [Streptomyces sp. NPDC056749]|uniref:hypothetical protein n=1 Tax=Streptomyces sp. NPDC056749 TaxID=3345936 RepID=UPI0036AF42CA